MSNNVPAAGCDATGLMCITALPIDNKLDALRIDSTLELLALVNTLSRCNRVCCEATITTERRAHAGASHQISSNLRLNDYEDFC